MEGGSAPDSNRIREVVNQLSKEITENFQRRWPSGGTIHIEDIQDRVELALMRAGEHKVVRHYILYREERRQKREEATAVVSKSSTTLNVTHPDGSVKPLNESWLHAQVSEACAGLADVNADIIIKRHATVNLFDGAALSEVYKAATLSARAMNEREPNYSYAAARLLQNDLRQEASTFWVSMRSGRKLNSTKITAMFLLVILIAASNSNILDPKLKSFNLEKLGSAIQGQRDLQFTYLGLANTLRSLFLTLQWHRL